MKIGIFTETYQPTMNGVVVSINTFKDQLEKKGHEYYIFAPEHPDQKKQKNVYRLPSFRVPRDIVYPLAPPLPLSMVRQQLPLDVIAELDIIHIQHYSAMGQYGLSLGQEFNIPTIYTYHTMAELYTHYVPIVGPLLGGVIRSWTRHTAGRADHVITPTQSVKKYLRSIDVEKPISVLPTGIDTSLYKRTPKTYLTENYSVPPQTPVLIFVGRLAAEKNVEFLLRAFQRVLLSHPNAQLMLVGDGPDRAKYERLVREWHIESHITFTGFVKREETIKLFGAADLFVFPSYTDTQGIVVIEAMAAGTVPVAIDRYGPHDIIQHNVTGKLVDLNLEKFSGTIINLLDNDEERGQLAMAAKQAAKKYDTKATAEAMENLYERLTSHSRSKSNP